MPTGKVNAKTLTRLNAVQKERYVPSVRVKMCEEMHQLLEAENRRTGVAMGEIALRLIAKGLHRPDLSAVPRMKMGRPRRVLAVSNSENGD